MNNNNVIILFVDCVNVNIIGTFNNGFGLVFFTFHLLTVCANSCTFLCFPSLVQPTMSSCGRRLRWRSCPGLFSLWSTAGAHTGNSGCSSTWNTRMLVLAVIVPRHARSTILHSYWSALFASVSAGDRAAGCLYTCRSAGGLQWTVNLLSLHVSKLKCKYLLSLTSTCCFPPSYLVTNLMGADLNNIVKFQRLSDEHVQFLIYQLLRGLKVITCALTRLLYAVLNASLELACG